MSRGRQHLSAATAPAPRTWLAPLGAVLTMQTGAAYAFRTIPVLAPVLIGNGLIAPPLVGYLTGLSWLGAMIFLIGGTPITRAAGAGRALQFGAAVTALGIACILVPLPVTLILASVLIGLGYGPSAPAGSAILQRHAPKRQRNLVFSIKQAGVPLGGIVAALLLPPLTGIGWHVAIGVSIALALFPLIVLQRLLKPIDADRDPSVRVDLAAILAPANLMTPLRAITSSAGLPRIAWAGFCFAVVQGTVFSYFITFAVAARGFDFAIAGVLFAVLQGTGVAGRIILGRVADGLDSTDRVLATVAVASAATTMALTVVSTLAGLLLLAAAAGFAIASWNGVLLAEVARLAPPAQVSEATSGVTLIVFIGYVLGPSGFGLLLEAGASYRLAFVVIAAVALAALASLLRRR